MDQSEAWEKVYKAPYAIMNPDPSFLAFMAEYYWGEKDLKFLDLGCGAGANSLFLISKGYKVTSIDFSKSVCDRLWYNLIGTQKELINIVNADLTKIEFEESSFDCILAVNLLEYLEPEQAYSVIKSARNWLKPGGRLFGKMLAQGLPDTLRHEGVRYGIYTPNEMSRLFSGYDAHHRPETRYIDGLAVNNWIILATKEEIALDDLKVTRIYFDSNGINNWQGVDFRDRLKHSSELGILSLSELPAHKYRCAIVGGAPTIKDHLDDLKTFTSDDIIVSINGAHEYLIKNGIVPTIHVLFEVDLKSVEQSTGGPVHKDVSYYVCSHCDKNIFKQLEDSLVVIWHGHDSRPEYMKLLKELFPKEPILKGGFVTFFRSISVAMALGYRHFEFFGCDCSFEGKKTHFDGYHNDGKERNLQVVCGVSGNKRTFNTTPSLSFLVNEFMVFCEMHPELIIKIHGDGLLKYMYESKHPQYLVKSE